VTSPLHKDTVFGLLTLAVAVAYYLMATAIPETVLGDAVGAAGLPMLYAYTLGALSLVLIARSSRQRAAGSGHGGSGQPSAVSNRHDEARHSAADGVPSLLRAAGVVALGVVYIVIVPWVGYMPGIAVLIGATAYYEGMHGRRVAIVAVCGAVFFWVLFVRVLGIAQPAGLWPSFD